MTQTRDGATTALHRRIEELTAELAMSRAKYDRDISDKEIAHQVDLATERAAHEQAEELRLSYWKEMQLTKQRAEQAERERDKALAERDTAMLRSNERYTQLRAAECEREEARSAARDWREHAQRAVSERDAALERVKELEAYTEQLKQRIATGNEQKYAAETALASARELLVNAHNHGGVHSNLVDWCVRRDAWLTSHPAPVAAPCAGCALLLRRLRELTEYYMLEVRNSEDRLKRVHRLQAQLARVGTRLHVKRAEAAHWQSLYSNRIKRCLQCRDLEARLEEVQHCCDKAVENRATIERMEADYDACHRQHEQCMKLLQRVRPYAPRHCKLDQLICEMLEKGELPEGWDE